MTEECSNDNPGGALAVPDMEDNCDSGEDLEQPIASLRPLDLSPCKVLLSLPPDVSMSHRQAIQKLLEPPLVLDEEIDLIIGSCESDVWERIERTVSQLTVGETGTTQISLPEETKPESQNDCNGRPTITHNACDKDAVIKVTLLSFQYVPFVYQLSERDLITRASFYKELGTKLFQRNNIPRAFQKYSRALKYLMLILDPEAENEEECLTLKLQCFLNLAACQMKQGGFEFVIKNCSEALVLDPCNVKALYRRGLALKQKKELQLAVNEMEKAHELEPLNKAVEKELAIIRTMLSKDESHLAKAMSKMFH